MHPDGHQRRLVRGIRPRATAPRCGRGRPSRRTPEAMSRCRSPTPVTTRCRADGVFVDDVVVSTGRGLHVVRGRRRHLRRLDGPRVSRPAARPTPTTGSPRQRPDNPVTTGRSLEGSSFARHAEIIDFLSDIALARTRSVLRRSSTTPTVGFALETRPGPCTPSSSDSVARTWWSTRRPPVVRRRHAVPLAAHVAQRGIRHLRRVAVERPPRGSAQPQEIFDSWVRQREPSRRPVLEPQRSANPGPTHLFDHSRCMIGESAMTLHRLRVTVGDEDFFPDPAVAGRS